MARSIPLRHITGRPRSSAAFRATDTDVPALERDLLPAVRQAPRHALVVANGFSGREQIAQATPRRGLHLAEVLDMAARFGASGPSGDLPERAMVVDHGLAARRMARQATWLAAGAAGAVLAGAAISAWRRQRT